MVSKRQILITTLWSWVGILLAFNPGFAAGLIVNEASNGNGGTKEFYELVVVGDSANPTTPVNLDRWIIDDNNGDWQGSTGGIGISGGSLRFDTQNDPASCAALETVTPGSILVIYNPGDPNPNLPADDVNDTNGDGIYILPATSSCLRRCNSPPSSTNSTYSACGTAGTPAYTPLVLRNRGDVAQVRQPDSALFHGFAYGDIALPYPPGSFNVATGSGTRNTYLFSCGNWFTGSNFSTSAVTGNPGETPGAANNPLNDLFIQAITNGSFDYNNPANPANCPQLDYGDAPDSYGTDLTNNSGEGIGASHMITPTLYLGSTAPDVDSNGFVDGSDDNNDATDDDATTVPGNGDDEDSIVSFAPLSPTDSGYTINAISVTNTTGNTANLVGWIDFDQNGTFDTDEAATVAVPPGTTSVSLSWTALPGITAGTTYARFRLTTDASIATGTASTSSPTGSATDGEVEDYALTIQIVTPFTCDGSLYQLAGAADTTLRRVVFSAMAATFTDIGSAGMNVNAGWGYNKVDNLLYGVRSGTQDLYRVDAAGVFTYLGPVSGMGTDRGSVAGDIDPNGILIFRSNTNTYYRVDLHTHPYAVVGSFTISGDAAGLNLIDIAYNQVDDLLYAVNGSKVYSIHPVTGVSQEIMSTSLGLTSASGAWFDEDGILYSYVNGNNTYYAVELTSQQTALLAVSDVDEGGNNDGMSCRGPRPVPLGLISGTVYDDTDKDDIYDTGVETTLPNITVNVYAENGTPGDFSDDTLTATTVTTATGDYAIAIILAFASNTYRIEADTTDPDLPAGALIGTPHPLTSVSVSDGGHTANQDFGFNTGGAVSGTVYADIQPNAALDNGETSTGEALFVKLLSRTGTTCSSPALRAVAAHVTTGAFVFSSVTDGDYCLIVDTNNTLTDITPASAPGWVFTGPSGGQRQLTVAAQTVPNQHFGLFHGSRLTGTVFSDNGSGGTANNGIQDGSEAGIPTVTVTATDGSSTLYDTTLTTADGTYTLFIPDTATTVAIIQANTENTLSTGGSAGTTSGTYDRPSDTVTFTATAGTTYSGVNFADVPVNTFEPDGAQSALPGTVIFYPHTFVAGTTGTISLGISSISTPAITGWNHVPFRDSNCNGTLDNGELQISAPINLVADEQLCLLVKVVVPAAAALGAQDQLTITTTFAYDNANPALSLPFSRTDTTTVGESAAAVIVKSVDKTTALPGEILTYTLTYRNLSSEAVSNMHVDDATPAYTTFVGASCTLPLPSNLTGCTVNTQPAVGAIGTVQWTFTGTLAPGASGSVQYQVQIDQ